MNHSLAGRATPEGTARFAARFPDAGAVSFFSQSRAGLTLSSIGMGLYKGAVSDAGDDEWLGALLTGMEHGINVFDTAIRYRATRSERILGVAVRQAIDRGLVRRDEVFISSKGGLIAIPEGQDRRRHVEEALVGERGVPRTLIYDDLHCLDPSFLSGELARSRAHLGLATLDCYFLHNPELAFFTAPKEDVYRRLGAAFAMLEKAVEAGDIAAYGLSSWNGFRRRPGSLFHIDLEKARDMARGIGGDRHHFRFVELPLSIGMPFARTEVVHARPGFRTALEQTATLELDVLTSASLYEGKLDVLCTFERLMRMAGRGDSASDAEPARVSLPVSENSIIQLFDVLLARRAARRGFDETLHHLAGGVDLYPAALNVVRSTPGVLVALAGMESREYATANLVLTRTQRCGGGPLEDFWRSLRSTPEGTTA